MAARKTRILCLHGMGTSGSIFNSQTSSFRPLLSDLDIEFNFIDAPYLSAPAPGVDLFFDPPYYCFWPEATVEAVRAARTWLNDLVARTGPYDAVMMFSQGCSLGASAFLLHQAETPHLPPPFKAAIFICGGAPLPTLESLGFEIPQSVWDRERASRKELAEQADSAAILARGAARWAGTDDSSVISEEETRKEIQGPYKIPVPTVHIYGSKDPRYVAGIHLSGLCDASKRKTYNHGGGHDIPRKTDVSQTIADLVRWVLAEAGVVSTAK
ncbi:hypothetical protein MPDQ_006785 [Monascus purpureus]|uniref:Serine hydrolase domain-containing protein n=1 Tax=Monascus purpureus TaxID=5098 RepID=A0A507QTK1_MONPU|nr:hypothetical protein MPDQ_006785 [Monascus purpureus]BDD57769.1 hypothetical protein MAP00_003111 [Monascus purpureus]